ncbi:ABC transporter ATP-binding protein [Marmoricola endophyticus]|uniref:ABC transporter ATP-binding protein n=1 Tax=Marmoricola endophyticus TaxID=2040280 RepID=A0A917BSP2_9ACTN|nr:ABC transporter ATP-binding protein [Marmoricola endophyticus]GGF55288.1 ABC transporter ATP-binding protein [Marmoricola endophyticus]
MPAAAPPATDAVALRGLLKIFRSAEGARVRAVDGLDLVIRPGEIVALLGPNGAGKTTTIDLLLGLTEPDAGSASVYGLPPRRAVLDGRVSAVLQTGGLLADLTVRETVRVVASTYPRPADVAEVIERTGLTALAGRRVSRCSGGEQQRLRFALALLPEPDLLVLDEPTAGMDVGARHEFWATMRAEAATGRTALFATHYLEEADAYAQRTVMVAGGRVVADGPTAEIRARASGRVVSASVPADRTADVVRRLEALSGVRTVDLQGDRVTVTSADSDEVAKALLNDLGGTGLEVATGSLETAFLQLTGTDAAHEETSR